jgi:hypothetical protein
MNAYTTTSRQPKKKMPTQVSDNVVESVRMIGSTVGKTVATDVAGRIAADALQSLLGQSVKSGEIRPQQTVEFPEEQRETQQEKRIQPREQINALAHQDAETIKRQIAAVRQELLSLAKSISNLHQEVQSAVFTEPIDPGVYHVNFFEQLKQMLIILRQQVEDSCVWLQSFQSRKKHLGYWGKYKKHGTSFGLSSERTTATQSG